MTNRNEDWKNSNFKATFSNKSNEPEDISSLRASREKDNYHNLNVATFTFGGRQNIHFSDNNPENINQNFKKSGSNLRNNNPITSKDKEREKDELEIQNFKNKKNSNLANVSNLTNNYNNTTINHNTNLTNDLNDISLNATVIANNQMINNAAVSNTFGPTIANKIGDHNSFLSVVIYALWNMKFMRNFIINDLNTLNEKESKNKLFYHLKSLFLKYERNKILDINKVRIALAETFQNRRKFLLDQPDDPVDCYFAFINSIHSHYIQTSLNEIKDTNCHNKCNAHKYLWIDLCRVDECECKGTSKRLFSYHNYIFEIPLEKIFNLTNNSNPIEMSKSFKLKSIGKNQQNNLTNELNSISAINSLCDLKGKLFLYYKLLFNQLKTDCPEKGHSCEVNRTHRAFFLANIPYNLSFSLANPKKYTKNLSHLEILKTFILIPKILDLSVLFDYSSKQKVFYEFFGAFLIKPSKAYSCFFRQNNPDETFSWVYYDCGKIVPNPEQNPPISFSDWFELVSFLLGKGEYPILLFYQIQQKYIDNEKDISNDEMQTLERYAKSADNFNSIVVYRFRPNEDIIKSEPSSSSNSLNLNNQTNDLNLKPSKGSSSISTSRNTSNNNSNSRFEISSGEYNCVFCFAKNRMDCVMCYKCNQNNEAVIEEILKKRHLNNNFINIANFNLNINTDEKMSFKTKDNGINQEKLGKSDKERIASPEGNNRNLNDNLSINIGKYDTRNERESKTSTINKKNLESIQPDMQKNPFQSATNKKEKERMSNINTNTINHDEELRMKHLNMPKQIPTKINHNYKQNTNKETLNYQMDKLSKEQTQNQTQNANYLNSPPSHIMERSNSKKNIQYNSNNPSHNNNNNPLYIPDNLKMKKMETITTSSYVSTPVFNKEREREKDKNIDKEKPRVIEDRFKPYDEREKRKINILNQNISNSQDKNYSNKNTPIMIEKKNNFITNPKNNHDHWICEACSSVNKNNNHKCSECKRSYTSSIRESFNKNDSYNHLSDGNFRETDSFSGFQQQETFGNRGKPDPIYVNQVQINLNSKKNPSQEKKQNTITSPPSEKKMLNNYFSEKNESQKSKGCSCQTNFDEALIRNNNCRLCGRIVDMNNYNSNQQITYLDNILKKKGYDDYSSNSSKQNVMKRNEKERPVMLHENQNKKRNNEFEKMKSPTSNNPKPKQNQTPLTIVNNAAKFDDDRLTKQNSNPFVKAPSKEKEKEKEKELSKQIRMNSTNKKNKIDQNRIKK